jgi:hypothetical protein
MVKFATRQDCITTRYLKTTNDVNQAQYCRPARTDESKLFIRPIE